MKLRLLAYEEIPYDPDAEAHETLHGHYFRFLIGGKKDGQAIDVHCHDDDHESKTFMAALCQCCDNIPPPELKEENK